MKRTITLESLKKILFENAQDWVYIDGIEITPTNSFGLNKRWKTWFFNSPQEALRFAKNMQDKHDGSSVETIRHSFDRHAIRTKDPDESWKQAIDILHDFTAAKTITINLGDLGTIEVPGDMDIERLQTRVFQYIRNEVERFKR